MKKSKLKVVSIVLTAVLTAASLLFSSCKDESSGASVKKVRDAGETPVASGEISIDDAVYFCRYNSPVVFGLAEGESKPECKAYPGTYWTKSSAATDCEMPYGDTFSKVPTELSTTPCDTSTSLALCTMDADYNNVTITYFYEMVPPPGENEVGLKLSSVKMGCEDFGGGIYEGPQYDATPSSPLLPRALDDCQTDATVSVTPDSITPEQLADFRENGGYIMFKPKKVTPRAGLIIYPGGFVDSRAFAPAARILAAQGIAVALIPVPEFLAISQEATDRPTMVIDATENANISDWFIAGHSLGGVAASMYAYNEERPVRGLIILGSYLSNKTDLSDREDLGVMTIVGSNEAAQTPGTIEYNEYVNAAQYAPQDTKYPVTRPVIAGGIHFYFCYQENPASRSDEVSEITREEQHAQYTDLIIEFIDAVLPLK